MVKITARKTVKLGKLKLMIAGGISRKGKPYIYAGLKNKAGISAGASVGSREKELHASYNKKRSQIGVRHNLTSNKTSPKLKYKGKRIC